MSGRTRLVALAAVLCASGCWRDVCIERGPDGARCSEEFHGIGETLGGETATDSEPLTDSDDATSQESCDERRSGTTCRDEGYGYYCERDAYWYPWRCK